MKPFFEQRDNDKKITCFNATENFPAHFHSGIEIAYTLSGVTVTSVGGKVCSAEKNSLVFFDSGEVHSIIECRQIYNPYYSRKISCRVYLF